ncbi:MAG TPA: hypothetical protein PLK76_01075 [bacterium]|jgi:hypothetical protein|nr:hypothetical protein [bacterium]
MLKKQNPHQHFKMTERDVSHFFSSRKNIAIFVAVVITVCFSSWFLINNDKTSNYQIVVPAEKSFKENQDDVSLKEKYQTEVKKIVLDYLEQRKNIAKNDLDNCQTIIKQTAEKIMQLMVPAEFKKFHLELVIAVDKENNYCVDPKVFANPESNVVWDELKLQNVWLSQ